MAERRLAVVYVAAAEGEVRAARGLIGRAIRKALGVKRWQEEPYLVIYDAEIDGKKAQQYSLYVTDEEMARLWGEIVRMSEAEGWDKPPVDVYHD
jgi:hypothetical protein